MYLAASEQGIQTVLKELQHCAVNPPHWPKAIQALSRLYGDVSIGALAVDRTSGALIEEIHRGLDPLALKEFRDHYFAINPRFQVMRSRARMNYDYQFIDEDGIRRSEFYAWARRHETNYYLAANNLGDDTTHVLIALFRGDRQGHFDASEIRTMIRLWPHIQSAMVASRALAGSALHYDRLCESLETLARPAVIIDDSAKVAYLNSSAETIFAARDGLAFDNHLMICGYAEDQVNFQVHIASALRASGEDRLDGVGSEMRIRRPSGLRPYSLIMQPLAPTGTLLDRRRSWAIVLIRDEGSVPPHVRRYATLHGLTPAEADVLANLANGISIEEIAHLKGRSHQTVRKQLASVFAKTGTHRQAELLATLSRSTF